jgi:IstB-like ATP binding protein
MRGLLKLYGMRASFDEVTGKGLAQREVRELATGTFLDAKRNAIFIGGTGTGKTHLGIAVALTVIRTRARGRFFNLVDLVNHRSTSPMICAPSFAGRRCQATGSSSSAGRSAPNVFTPRQVGRLQLSARQGNVKSMSVDNPVDKL